MPINETRKVIQSDILNKYASPIKWEIANVNNYKPEAGELIINSGSSKIEEGHPVEPIIKVGDGVNNVGALISIGSKYDLNLISDTDEPDDGHGIHYLKKGLLDPDIAVNVMSLQGNNLITIKTDDTDPTQLTVDTEIITLENNKSEVNISEKLKVLKSAEIVGNLVVKKYKESEFTINETATSNKHLATGCVLAGAGHSISSDQVICGGNEVIIGQSSAATIAVGNNLNISNSPFNAVFGRNNVIKYTSDTIVAGCNNCVSGQEPTEGENAKYATNSAIFGIRNTSTSSSQLIAGQDNVVKSWLGSAIGRHLKVDSAENNARLAIGQFNADTTYDALFVIGNGNWTTGGSGYRNPVEETGIDGQTTGLITRDNAFVVYYNGSATVGSGHSLSGKSSNFISGWFNQTTNDYETALGKYNRSSKGMIFSIGNGTRDNDRSNVFEIHDNQNIIMQDAAISGGNYNFAAGNNAVVTTEMYASAKNARSNVDSLAGNLGDSNFAINAGFIGGMNNQAANGSFAANGGVVLGSGFAAAFNKSTIEKDSYNSFATNNGKLTNGATGSVAFNNSEIDGATDSFAAAGGRIESGCTGAVVIGKGIVSGGTDNITIGKGTISSTGHSNILLGTDFGACYIRNGSLNIVTGKGKVNKGYNTVLMNDAIADDDIGSLAIDAARLNFTQFCFASGRSTIQGVNENNRVWEAAAFGTGTIVKQSSGSAFGRYNTGDNLFEIGNGDAITEAKYNELSQSEKESYKAEIATDDTKIYTKRSNAFSVNNSGNATVGNNLTVNNSIAVGSANISSINADGITTSNVEATSITAATSVIIGDTILNEATLKKIIDFINTVNPSNINLNIAIENEMEEGN